MEFKLPDLPYSKDALEPGISTMTVSIHYDKHHRGYMTKLEKAIADTPESSKSLEELVQSTEGYVFNQAAQVWNHTFYWKSMKPGGGGKPDGALLEALTKAFGNYEDFKQQFAEAARDEFGSGWAWLVKEGDALRILSTSDAENPLQRGLVPLIACDVWEHAYYLDYKNERDQYVERFIDSLLNWDFAQENFR